MTLPIDRTAKSALDTNLVNGNTSDAPKIKNNNDTLYNTVDELNNKVDGMVQSGVLSPYPPADYNKLINGNFDVWQRGTSWTNPGIGVYTSDRWRWSVNVTGLPVTLTHSKQAQTPGDVPNSFYFYRLATDGAGSSPVDYRMQQHIEMGARYLCGAGKKVTVSLWARSSIANKRIGVHLLQNYGSGGSPSAQEVINGASFTLSSTWTKFTFTFATNTLVSKIFGTNNDDFLSLNIGFCWDATLQSRFGASTAETFGGAGNIDIAQVQVNAGDTALPFQPRSFAEELALCQRYYEKSYTYGTAPGTAATTAGMENKIVPSNTISNAQTYGKTSFKVKKRIAPTVTIYPYTTPSNTGQVSNSGGADLGANTGGVTALGDDGFVAYNNNGASITTTLNTVIFHWSADAEL